MRNESNWLSSYLEYTKPLESPTSYHIWSGIGVVAACLGRRVWADVGFRVYPNLYIVLVGGAGKCRKTSAITAATSLVENLTDVKLSADSITREALIRALKQSEQMMTKKDGKIYTHSSLTIISKELSVFLGTGNHDLLSLLTDLYDCSNRWEYRTKGSGIDTIFNAWLNLLGASTPAWLVGSMPLTAIGGGFTSRVIFIVEDNVRHKNAFPILDKALAKRLSMDLEEMSMMVGRINMTTKAKDFFEYWYINKDDNTLTDPRFLGYMERKHVHLIKTALILCACDKEANNEMKEIHLIQALQFLDDIEKNMTRAFGAAGRSPIAADIDTILTTIRNAGGMIDKNHLISAIAMDVHPKEIDIVADTLQRMGHIEIKFDPKSGNVFYKAIKKEK